MSEDRDWLNERISLQCQDGVGIPTFQISPSLTPGPLRVLRRHVQPPLVSLLPEQGSQGDFKGSNSEISQEL